MTAHTPTLLTSDIRLRDVIESDLPIFFEQQRDPDANHMAAFPARASDAFIVQCAMKSIASDNDVRRRRWQLYETGK
jgi:hypothetical protein